MEHILKVITEVKEVLLTAQSHQKEILSFEEACRFLDLSNSSLYKLTSKKEIPHFKPNGRKIYFKRVELLEWIEEGRINTIFEEESMSDSYLNRNSENLAS